MSIRLNFTPGLPPVLSGACIFLLWDGSLCEGELIQRDGRHVLVHYNLAALGWPQRIEKVADRGAIQGYAAPIADPGRAQASPWKEHDDERARLRP